MGALELGAEKAPSVCRGHQQESGTVLRVEKFSDLSLWAVC